MLEFNRRDLAFGTLTAGLALSSVEAAAKSRGEISRTNAAIHQEIIFQASAAHLYQTLTVAEQFDHVVRLSGAMNSSMKAKLGTAPTAIDAQPGGAFAFFGGYITGRNLELVSDTRIVQAWRAGSWDPHLYSIANFVLVPQAAGTRLVFDHTGFPNTEAETLAKGWHENYWQPIANFLG